MGRKLNKKRRVHRLPWRLRQYKKVLVKDGKLVKQGTVGAEQITKNAWGQKAR